MLAFCSLRSLAAQVEGAESDDSGEIAGKLEKVLKRVEPELRALIKFEFGITFYEGDIHDVNVSQGPEERGGGSRKGGTISVSISGVGSVGEQPVGEGDAKIEVKKGQEEMASLVTTITIKGSKGHEKYIISHNIGKKLVQAFQDSRVKAKVMAKVQEAEQKQYGVHSGSSQFQALVKKLTGSLSPGTDAKDIASTLATGLQKAESDFQTLVEKDFGAKSKSFDALVKELKTYLEEQLKSLGPDPEASQVAEKIRDALQSKQDQVGEVVKHDFGIQQDVKVSKDDSESKVTVKIGTDGGEPGSATITVEKGGSESFTKLVQQLKGKVGTHLTGDLDSAEQIAQKLQQVLVNLTTQIKELPKNDFNLTTVQAHDIQVRAEGDKIEVTIGTGGSQKSGTSSVSVTPRSGVSGAQTITIEVKLKEDLVTVGDARSVAEKIAKMLALAMVSKDVKSEFSKKEYGIALSDGSDTVAISVQGSANVVDTTKAKAIAARLAKVTEQAAAEAVQSLSTVDVTTEAKPIEVKVEAGTPSGINTVTIEILGLGGGQGTATLLVLKGINNLV